MREADLNNYYNMLGLTSQATPDEIEEAYTKLRRKYQQLLDTGIGLVGEKQKAEVDLEILTIAYKALVDGNKRNYYDNLLPPGVKSWDDRFGKEKSVCTWWGAPPTEHQAEAHEIRQTVSGIRSKFGMPSPSKDPTLSSFDRPEVLRPVSQLIRSRQTVWYKIKRFLFGW